MKIRRVLTVIKRSTYERLRDDDTRDGRKLKEMIERGEPATLRVRESHEEHVASVQVVRRVLRKLKLEVKERARLPDEPRSRRRSGRHRRR
ncbi:MAG: hypothetical protein HC923_13280 [Myxococcales bacterium]|nr:hypothetical protein [Myxococcales bacterium]